MSVGGEGRPSAIPRAWLPADLDWPKEIGGQVASFRASIGDSGGQLLVIYHAAPGSDSARGLSLLAAKASAEANGPAREYARRVESLSVRQRMALRMC